MSKSDQDVELEEFEKEEEAIKEHKPKDDSFLGNPKVIFLDQWREQLAELWGTMIFVFLGTGSAIAAIPIDGEIDASCVLCIAFGFGFGITTMIYATANISGGHLNPAVTIGILVARKISVLKAFCFIFWQCVGAVLGSVLISGTIPDEISGKIWYGVTTLTRNGTIGSIGTEGRDSYSVEVYQGLIMEIVLTYLLVFTVFATAGVTEKRSSQGKFAPFSIGLAVLSGHLVGVPFTGPSMNPARTFGPALVSGHWDDYHWIYWVGPIIGGIGAALTYHYIFTIAEETKKTAIKETRHGHHA